MPIGRHVVVSSVEHCDSEFALHGWEPMQRLVQALATFQLIEERAHWNTGTDKHKTSAEDIGVSVCDSSKRKHGHSPYGL
jgi:hypothetical protein